MLSYTLSLPLHCFRIPLYQFKQVCYGKLITHKTLSNYRLIIPADVKRGVLVTKFKFYHFEVLCFS